MLSHIGVQEVTKSPGTVRRYSPHAEGGMLNLDLQLAILKLASQALQLNF